MQPPSDFVVPHSVQFWAYTYNSLVHVTENGGVHYHDLNRLPPAKTLVCFDLGDDRRYTRECVLLQVIQNKSILQKLVKRWEKELSVTTLVHFKYKYTTASNGKERQYKFVDIDNRPIRLLIPTDSGRTFSRLGRMIIDHCYVIEITYAYGKIETAKVLVDTTASTRIGKPTWLQKLSQP
jgi:hypothetical protein